MLSSKRYHKLFSPIALLYDNPISLQGKLFPTMMDDQLLAAKAAMSVEAGKWYNCPNGHPYFIGDVREIIFIEIQLFHTVEKNHSG